MNMTKLAIGTLVASLSMNASASFMTATADGGFVVKDAGEWVQLDGTTPDAGTVIDINGAAPGGEATVYEGVRWGGSGKYSSLILTNVYIVKH